ncbi:hypothetical protein EI42_04127 [Thermosporothrix hazakensis]|jgi:hypothetical protein|uniref:PH (Pleckstrin Homology) domain-containing protein n=2 Tax=Thermosporothrix TaxID=768650 RepID=A0A326U373_THEHA|nr:hypothetical protein [Thermosporothrix hazakensis]PZW25634.1 hypothetical protein EI42_04127 [Thermosporothrix hazakensis]BBH89929.1 hypothetical protein KTC_46800 [Thermosporothrix sp. COM3]GCE48129.1 hypothetical protein KTH_29980 [Thermosporothrix hazakensis]
MASSSPAQEQGQIFIGPGLSRFKLVVTTLGIIGAVGVVLWIAYYQIPSFGVGSTILALLFILGFVYYLRLIAPVPFTISLTEEGVIKRNKRGEEIKVRWEDLTRVKEEFFPNGKRISVIAYRKVTEPGQKPKAWAVYRDDVTDLDGLAAALKSAIPETCEWVSETVHE